MAPDMDFETIWGVTFSMENKVVYKKNIWFVQDTNEERSQRRNLGQMEMREDRVGLIDFCAYAGAMWFVLTTILIGPINRLLAKGVFTADVVTGEIKTD